MMFNLFQKIEGMEKYKLIENSWWNQKEKKYYKEKATIISPKISILGSK